MIPEKQIINKKLYFGKMQDSSKILLQIGKKAEVLQIPLITPRTKYRKKGSSWKETYANNRYKIKLNATPTTPKLKNKYTYYMNFRYTDKQSGASIKKTIMINCKT